MSDEGVPLEQIENTVLIDASPDEVYVYLTTVERLDITDAVTTDWRGGRAILAIAPEGDGSMFTMMVDAPAGAEANVEMRVRMRHELARVAAAVESRGHGGREAPFADDPSHRP